MVFSPRGIQLPSDSTFYVADILGNSQTNTLSIYVSSREAALNNGSLEKIAWLWVDNINDSEERQSLLSDIEYISHSPGGSKEQTHKNLIYSNNFGTLDYSNLSNVLLFGIIISYDNHFFSCNIHGFYFLRRDDYSVQSSVLIPKTNISYWRKNLLSILVGLTLICITYLVCQNMLTLLGSIKF